MMATAWSRTAAFRFFNTEPRNPNWSWSARSADGKTVAVTLWRHEFEGPAGKMVYAREAFGTWHKGSGSRVFLEDLLWAFVNCAGIVRVIVAVRDRGSESVVRTAECYPQKSLVMRVTYVDPETGAFRLEQVVPSEDAASNRTISSSAGASALPF
jgi:hypothetical protein